MHGRESVRSIEGDSSNHHTVDPRLNLIDVRDLCDSPVERQADVRYVVLKAFDHRPVERGNIEIESRGHAAQIGDSRVNDDTVCAVISKSNHEIAQPFVTVDSVSSKSALHRDWQCSRLLHGVDDGQNFTGSFHETRAKSTTFYPF